MIDETPAEEIDATWGAGNSALHLSSFLGESDYLPLLLRAGANPHLLNSLDNSPIDVACDDEIREIFAGMGHVSTKPAKPQAPKPASGENRRQSMNAYKDRKSFGHAELKVWCPAFSSSSSSFSF